MDLYAKHMRTIRLAKACDSTKSKIEIGILHAPDADKMWNIIKAQLLERKLFKDMPGVAPPGHMEDQLQSALESLGENSEGSRRSGRASRDQCTLDRLRSMLGRSSGITEVYSLSKKPCPRLLKGVRVLLLVTRGLWLLRRNVKLC